ncbi:intradiol ring-cleavage dioxygenase [Pseudomonas tolaasii]|uniref:Intradiol ring-cleavage dioxygenase n=2 Tax=Pseudomonas tolaasii TaxID=29442 RepID=A0A7Y8AHW0_PSETO|nr:intradiol ring-cleavage dioxygenase [Pseudomonas tolaasii]ARB30213.1 6-chlorohydroxyquinol-1,2-dioxygenase [Pseudomonas tolaasii]KAB0466387.1 intradiol ring-cleavage dioxygenase [Pseudomonas tolaasii]MBY8941934.1 intradiol ring-cleavage dioxygenase [Pseudomonas tolaasii]NWC23878.1 intradiol ring-cleavage dioxygenase [Pseudomonas tolaasii]NWC41711.1 intradiol ring-cleavage dioxygenase [Pseudomonas tolaasii]
MNPVESLITEKALNSFEATPDPRFKQIMHSLVRHLHAFASEVELTEQEWFEGIRFLTDTGHMCDGFVRQEFILLSDTLGLSMLVDAINHRQVPSATETTVFGPFYIDGMPDRAYGENMALTPGEATLIHGRVLDTDGKPLAGVLLDVWQTAGNGMYSGQDVEQPSGNLRGRYRTDANGDFAMRTILPVCYPIPTDGPVGRMLDAANRHSWRPGHVHFILELPGYRKLVTHLFTQDDPYLDSDAVFGVKESLQVAYEDCSTHDAVSERVGMPLPFKRAYYEFVLESE